MSEYLQPPRRGWLRPWHWWTLLAAGLLAGLLAYALAPGLAATTDSRYYLAAARSFLAVGELRNPNGTPYTYWGPLYPLELAALLPAGCWAVGAMQLVATVLSLVLWSWLGWRLLPSPATARWYILLLAVAVPALVVAKFVWAEAGFSLLFAGYGAALYQYHQLRQRRWWLLATVWAVLLPLQRTSGLFLVLGAAGGLLLLPRAHRWPLGPLLAVTGAGMLAALGWQGHTWLLGRPARFVPDLGSNWLLYPLSTYGFVLVRWLLPLPTPPWPPAWGYAVLLGGWAWASSWVSRHCLPEFSRVLVGSIYAYLLLHIVSAGLSRSNASIGDVERYLAVVHAPVLLLAVAGARQWLHRWPRWQVLLAALWLTYSAGRAVRNVHALRHRPVVELSASE